MNSIKVPREISAKVLTIGNQYKNHRGGIGGVIETYSDYFEEFNFVPTYKPQKVKFLIVPYYLLGCLKMIFIFLTKPGIRIVHIHGAARGSIYRKAGIFVLARYVFIRRVIYHSHGSELKLFYETSGRRIKRLMKFFFEGVDEVVCLSRQWEDFFRSGFNVKKATVLENIVVKNESQRINQIQEGETIVFLFLGTIGKRKGIFDLLEALAENKHTLAGKIRLIIGGDGEVKKLTDYIDEHGLQELVQFEGWVSGEKKRELFLQSNVYILPSYNEGLPLSILEAMSYRLAIISTPMGGTPEVVKNGKNGFLVEPRDKAGILQSLQWFVQSPELVKPFGEYSGELVVPYYAENVIPKLTEIYRALLHKNQIHSD